MMKGISRFAVDQSGLATIEYALLLAFVGVAIAIAMSALGQAVTGQMSDTTAEISE